MEVRQWSDEPVEELAPGLGRQMLHTERLTVARILLAAGAVVPRHRHENEQVANVLSGRLRFVVAGDTLEVAAGESIALPANVEHEVTALEDAVVIDVFSPPREDWIRGDDGYLRAPQD